MQCQLNLLSTCRLLGTSGLQRSYQHHSSHPSPQKQQSIWVMRLCLQEHYLILHDASGTWELPTSRNQIILNIQWEILHLSGGFNSFSNIKELSFRKLWVKIDFKKLSRMFSFTFENDLPSCSYCVWWSGGRVFPELCWVDTFISTSRSICKVRFFGLWFSEIL